MKAAIDKCPKGAALLAAAGVSLVDAQWLFSAQRASDGPQDQVRLGAIRRKVGAFVAMQSSVTARVRRAA
jgi:hypothetical protein